jgi:mannose-6-phosphate isomerase-like protein (cupin superfamily)
MRVSIRAIGLFSLVAGGGSIGTAHGQTPGQPELISDATLKSYVLRTKDGLVARLATADPSSRTLVVRRERSGETEVHDAMNDVIVAREGHATIVMGGKAEGGRQTGPGEWIGGRIVGGREYRLQPGDVLWIPAGTPHRMLIEPAGTFSYLAIKSAK